MEARLQGGNDLARGTSRVHCLSAACSASPPAALAGEAHVTRLALSQRPLPAPPNNPSTPAALAGGGHLAQRLVAADGQDVLAVVDAKQAAQQPAEMAERRWGSRVSHGSGMPDAALRAVHAVLMPGLLPPGAACPRLGQLAGHRCSTTATQLPAITVLYLKAVGQ